MRLALDSMFENETSGLGVIILDGKDGPALRISDEEARALVARVIERSRASPVRARNATRRRILPFVVGAVMATSAAAASYQRSWPLPWFGTREPVPASGVPPAPAAYLGLAQSNHAGRPAGPTRGWTWPLPAPR